MRCIHVVTPWIWWWAAEIFMGILAKYEFNCNICNEKEIEDIYLFLRWIPNEPRCAIFQPPHNKTNTMESAPSEDSDQPGHPPSLIRVFVVRIKKAWVLSYSLSAQRRLWSDWADAQAVLSHRWAHMPFCWFYHEVAQIYFIECVENISFFTSAYWWYFQYMRRNIFGIYRNFSFLFILYLSGQ